jgi:hypothetical protein
VARVEEAPVLEGDQQEAVLAAAAVPMQIQY